MSRSVGKWLLLVHQIPPKPPYLRAKVLRRLNRLGAVAVKNSVYVLPGNNDSLEDFQWLCREIRSGGGHAWLFQADVLAGTSDHELQAAFCEVASREYEALEKEARTLLEELRSLAQGESGTEAPVPAAPTPGHGQEWQRIRRRCAAIHRIDFFDAAGAAEVQTLMAEIDRTLRSREEVGEADNAEGTSVTDLRARTWVTRRDVGIDRIASAWLIRRFIDPAAKFAFVDGADHVRRPSDVCFDMFEGEFSHRGNQCTFEVLVDHSQIDDAALREIGEIVHDIDLKDELYGRPEAVGLAMVIDGIMLSLPDDARRLEEGARVFDALYERLREDLKGGS